MKKCYLIPLIHSFAFYSVTDFKVQHRLHLFSLWLSCQRKYEQCHSQITSQPVWPLMAHSLRLHGDVELVHLLIVSFSFIILRKNAYILLKTWRTTFIFWPSRRVRVNILLHWCTGLRKAFPNSKHTAIWSCRHILSDTSHFYHLFLSELSCWPQDGKKKQVCCRNKDC